MVLHDVHVDVRHLADAKHGIVVEVPLLHAALVDRDLAIQRRSEPGHDRAAHLRFHYPRMDYLPTVRGAGDLVHAHFAILDRHFRYLGDETPLVLHDRDPASASRRQWLSPTRPFGRDFEHVSEPRITAE